MARFRTFGFIIITVVPWAPPARSVWRVVWLVAAKAPIRLRPRRLATGGTPPVIFGWLYGKKITWPACAIWYSR